MGFWSKAKKAGKSLKKDVKKRGKAVKGKASRAVKNAPARAGRMASGIVSTVEGAGRTAMNLGEAVGEAGSAVIDTGIAGAHTTVGAAKLYGHSLVGGAKRAGGELAHLSADVAAGALDVLPAGDDAKNTERAEGLRAWGDRQDAKGHKAQIESAGKATKGFKKGLKKGKKSLKRAKTSLTKGIPKQLEEAAHSAEYMKKSGESVARFGSSGKTAERIEKEQRYHRDRSGGAYLGAETPLDAVVGALAIPGVGSAAGKGIKYVSKTKVGKSAGKVASKAGKSVKRRAAKSRAGRWATKRAKGVRKKAGKLSKKISKTKQGRYLSAHGAGHLAKRGTKAAARGLKRTSSHIAERWEESRERTTRGKPKY